MNPVNKMKALKGAVALAAILAMSGSAFGKKNGNGGGVPADLSPDRTTATVTVSAQCTAIEGTQGTVSVYILQSVGRLINIGNGAGTATIPCNGTAVSEEIVVTAFSGLTFQPGPATLIIKLTRYGSSNPADPTAPLAVVGTSESGSRVDLH